MTPAHSRLVLRGGRVLRGDLFTCASADVLIEDGRILAIENPGDISPEHAAAVDATDRLLIPGLVNGHTHGHGALGKGLVDDRVPLEVFLSASGAINGHRSVEDKRLTAQLTAVELIRKGCTACYDLFVEIPAPSREGLEAVASAYAGVGMRAVVAPMMADLTLYQALPGLMEALPESARAQVATMQAAPYDQSLLTCRAILQGWAFDRDFIRPAIAPAIPLHCTDEFLTGCANLSAEFDVGLQTHLAETRTQAVLGVAKFGRSLVAHLDVLGVLGPRFSGAHGIWIDADDIARLATAGAAVVHNPMSNLRIGSGVAPARAMLDAGVTLAIGTDASNTSDGQNMFEALRLAAYLSRVADPDPRRWLSAQDAFRAATAGSAKALGFAGVGQLEPGYAADIVFIDLRHINYVPLRAPLLQLAFAENGAAVDGVMIGGRMVLEHGRVLTIDEDRLRREAQSAIERLDRLNEHSLAQSRTLGKLVGCFCLAHARSPLQVHRRLPNA